ncbi:hypothetical protein BaRGS_00021170 [Batillaria attramentaria]|uniref:HIT-type domain-containing protein n=1 Tax=Batillaria attramentaria TaxID=370345 RepID=A0ABD0KKB4_9CAEN
MAASIKILQTDDDELTKSDQKDCCSICVNAEAQYTCPRCNIRYCSLSCYRHEKHQGCSESFYRDCVLEEMKEYSARPEDRQKVMEMLEREHEASALDSDDDDEPDLAERLEGLDLDKDGGEIWQRLTDKEKEEFASMVRDGRLSNIMDVWTPWWTQQSPASELIQETDKDPLPKGFPTHVKDIPDISQLLKHSKPSADSKYNVINLLSAYVFVTRLHNGDHHDCPLDTAEELLQVCAVLRENKSCSSAREAIQLVLQDIQKEGSGFIQSASSPVVMTEDLLQILTAHQSSPITPVISALSDTAVILKKARTELKKDKSQKGKEPTESGQSSESDTRHQLFLAKKKVTFLASWAQRYGMCLTSLAPDLALELEAGRVRLKFRMDRGSRSRHLLAHCMEVFAVPSSSVTSEVKFKMSQQNGAAAHRPANSDQNVQNGHGWSGNVQQGGATAQTPPGAQGGHVTDVSPGADGRARRSPQVPVEDADQSHPILPCPRTPSPTQGPNTPTRREVLERLRRENLSIVGGSSSTGLSVHKTAVIYRIVVTLIVLGALACIGGVCSPFWFRSVGRMHAEKGTLDVQNVTFWGLWEACFTDKNCVAPLKFKSNLMTCVRVTAVLGAVGYMLSSCGFFLGCFHRCYSKVRHHACKCLLLFSAFVSAMTAVLYGSIYHSHVTEHADFFVSFYLVLGAALLAMACCVILQVTDFANQYGLGQTGGRSIGDVEAAGTVSRSSPASRDTVVLDGKRGDEERQPLMDNDSLGNENEAGQAGESVVVSLREASGLSESVEQSADRDVDPERLTGPVPKDLSNIPTGLKDDAGTSADGHH